LESLFHTRQVLNRTGVTHTIIYRFGATILPVDDRMFVWVRRPASYRGTRSTNKQRRSLSAASTGAAKLSPFCIARRKRTDLGTGQFWTVGLGQLFADKSSIHRHPWQRWKNGLSDAGAAAFGLATASKSSRHVRF